MNEEQILQEPQGNGVLPCVSGSLSEKVNLENKTLYEKLKQQHIEDGGKHADAYAMTELIKKSIVDKTYRLYRGGGREQDANKTDTSDNRIRNYDVVVWFNFGGDAFFQICMDNSEGDSCVLWNSNAECEFMKKVL